MTYTYDPKLICDKGRNQLRFELGDTAVEQGGMGCGFSDEEYDCFLNEEKFSPRAWLELKLYILKCLLNKFAFQVNTKVDVLEYDFTSRVLVWERLRDQLEKEISVCQIPISTSSRNSKPYFYENMLRR